MARWTGTWLSGPAAAGAGLRSPDSFPGDRLGLPEQGPGSVATLGLRGGAFAVDIVGAALVAGLVRLFVTNPSVDQRNIAGYVVFAVVTICSLALTGRTPGMQLLGLRVRPVGADAPALGLVPAVLRTAVLATFILALVVDRDRRGLHDRVAGTVVVRA